MTYFWASLILLITAAAAYIGIEMFRRYSLRKKWVDVPNERSSHQRPTPRGGGLVVVLLCTTVYVVLSLAAPGSFSLGYLVGAVIVAAISWFDDLRSIGFAWRLLIHVLAAVLVVVSVGPLPLFAVVDSSWAGLFESVVTVAWIVWMINAYNFMDGIDGIAGVQALVASGAWFMVAAFVHQTSAIFYMAALFGAVTGFLVLNWSPAKIFLGDVGSAFLGFTFAAMPLLMYGNAKLDLLLPLAAVLFLWPFIFDSILTLFRRLVKAEKIWVAHRNHLYQRLVIAGYSHAFVSKLYALFAVASAAVGLNLFVRPNAASSVLLLLLAAGSIAFAVIVLLSVERRSRDREVRNVR